MYTAITFGALMSPILFSLDPKCVRRGKGFGKWLERISVYTLTLAILAIALPVLLNVISPEWFEDIEAMVRDTAFMAEMCEDYSVVHYAVRQTGLVACASAICLAIAQLVCRRTEASELVSLAIGAVVWVLMIILAFRLPASDVEFYQKLFDSIEWGAEHIWYFAVGAISFCVGRIIG